MPQAEHLIQILITLIAQQCFILNKQTNTPLLNPILFFNIKACT